MIALIQRVTEATVTVDGDTVGEIGPGMLALVAVERADTEAQADRLLERLLGYRVFNDADGRMNLSLKTTQGGLLLVPQFTLAADTAKGTRAGFSRAAKPEHGEKLFLYLVENARKSHPHVASGNFGANMQIRLVNDGPVTFWLEARERA